MKITQIIYIILCYALITITWVNEPQNLLPVLVVVFIVTVVVITVKRIKYLNRNKK